MELSDGLNILKTPVIIELLLCIRICMFYKREFLQRGQVASSLM